MKSPFLKFAACVMLVGVFQFTHAQAAASVATPGPAKPATAQSEQAQVKRANDLVDRIAGEVELTTAQKAKLQVSMKEAIGTYNNALQKSKKDDDSKLGKANAALVADIEARIKVILTTEQFNAVMSKENSSN